MDNNILIALVDALINEAIAKVQLIEGQQGPRGLRGEKGLDFQFDDHRKAIEEIIVSNFPKHFELTEDQITLLKGEKGEKGRDGKSITLDDVTPFISDLVQNTVLEHKLKFSDLSEVEIEALKLKFSDLTDIEREGLRGPKGFNGKDGQDFIFEDHEPKIIEHIKESVLANKDNFKIKFSDLSEDDKKELKGPRGQRGKPGQDFIYDDHAEVISEVISNTITNSYENLKLKYCDLLEADKEELKLKFDDLTDDNKKELRGARGQRGKQGHDGLDGKDAATWILGDSKPDTNLTAKNKDLFLEVSSGDVYFYDVNEWVLKGNIRGAIGPMGPRGLDGKDGKSVRGQDGINGKDAPYITEIKLDERYGSISLTFYMSDGEEITTNKVNLPVGKPTYIGGGGGYYPSVGSISEYFDEGISLGIVSKIDFTGAGVTATKVGDKIVVDIPGGGGSATNELLISKDGSSLGLVEEIDFLGSNITVNKTGTKVEVSVDPSSGTGQPITVKDEGVVRTTKLKNINFVGNGVRVKTETFMSDWDALSDVDELDAYSDADTDSVIVEIVQQDNSILSNVDCDISVFLGAVVRMDNSGIAHNALADSYANSNVIGIVEEKASDTKCTIRVSGYTIPLFTGLDTALDYFLSDSVPGGIVSVPPVTSGHVKVPIGQAFSSTRFLFRKGERVVRA